MNNLSSFADFSKGAKHETKNIEVLTPESAAEVIPVDKEQTMPLDTPPPPPPLTSKKFTAHYAKFFGKKQPHEELKDVDVNMKPFKKAYESTEKEYTSLLRELNRIESGKANLKKDVVDLKKCFSDLLVKLQFFAEYVQPEEKTDITKEEKEKP